jgi:electron transfer flavoprotein beta subunit
LRIVACTKETPDTAAKVEVGADGVVTWGDAPLVINPWDEYAVEEGLQLVENKGADGCTVLAVGTEVTKEALKHAIAMGCDQAILISDPALENADTLLLSHALAQGIKKVDDAGLVILGKVTTDGGSGQTAVQVGRRLGWNTLTFISKILEIDFDAKTIKVERLLEEGKQIVESTLPAVLSVIKDINEPRYPSFMGIRKASKAEIPVWSAADIGLDEAVKARVTWQEIYALPPREGECEIIEAEAVEEAAATLADRLIGEKVI